MKKTVLGMALVATTVLGNVAMAEENDSSASSTNTVTIIPGDGAAKITAAPSYNFGDIKPEDIKKGFKDVTVEESADGQTLDFTNDTFKDITISVTASDLVKDTMITEFDVTYTGGTEVIDTPSTFTKGNEVSISEFKVVSDSKVSTPLIIKNPAALGNHKIAFASATANFKFDESKASATAQREFTQKVTWTLGENGEQKVAENTL
ncbi:hypothetical protein OL233_02690 [Vagococcus sp. PNs007]|uniref:WxL domain-containing protein n=1 Tax=Vagococcus proximus TaxID=2991417 RepID=A0ABT5WZN3_9ENTE|nr:hypothetical protein [Vagococcus proximus]MDF0479184.1 hypothetical protein [Vagococcus proximus]